MTFNGQQIQRRQNLCFAFQWKDQYDLSEVPGWFMTACVTGEAVVEGDRVIVNRQVVAPGDWIVRDVVEGTLFGVSHQEMLSKFQFA